MGNSRESKRNYRRRHREAISRRRTELRQAKISRDGIEGERARARRSRHGANYLDVLAQAWADQGGCCYLCGDQMEKDKAVMDHDHTCCRPQRTCKACRRGLACHRCNRLIGQCRDDPELLRRIADNLEIATKAARLRIAEKPRQLELSA